MQPVAMLTPQLFELRRLHMPLVRPFRTSFGTETVRYYVTAYDSAGNESNASSTISLAKNQCS